MNNQHNTGVDCGIFNYKGKRNPTIFLFISLRFAKEYLRQLQKMRNNYTEAEIQESKNLTIIHRALWTALIVEIRKLFESSKFENYSLRKIDFFKKEPYKSKIDYIYGDRIIQKILNTGYTFTTHLGKNKKEICPIAEICNSNLDDLLDKLDDPLKQFENYYNKHVL